MQQLIRTLFQPRKWLNKAQMLVNVSKMLPENVCRPMRLHHTSVKCVTVSCCLQMVIHKAPCRLDVTCFTIHSIKRSYRTVTVLLSLWPSLKINFLIVMWSPHFLCQIFYCAPQLEFLLSPVSGCSRTVTVDICKFAFPYPKDFVDKTLAVLCWFIFFLVLWQLSTAFGSPSSLSKLSSRRYSHSG